MTPWEIEGVELVNCNCAYGCPCQFNALPTHGHCQAAGAIEIHRGHHGDVSLDGTRIAFIFQWPGPIHEGGGKCQPIVDESADEAQRMALLKIMSGEDSEPGRTMFNVFASTLDQVFDPAFRKIAMTVDVDERRGSIHVDGFIDTAGEPIRNPVTGQPHRARIDLPNGFEYSLAEIGSASTQTKGPIALSLKDSYGQFARLHLSGQGPVRH
ncbi:DUF1326 domain-containing protein [Jiella endophytica]|uniref:DUF1326 domain-containing protein n=1 Tax=Jiella endophytica TaxID=2558362 RepID=A0A4Y8RAK8_9HYPH|nr:DUF1326 domain-containing protein [Jiella endophytica]TFF18375.1 DUF1326 domain-containing protein [Jiella endophytica]